MAGTTAARRGGGRSLTAYLALFAAALLLPVIVVAGLLAARYAQGERERYGEIVRSTARELVLALDRDLAGIGAMTEALALSDALARSDLAAFHRQAATLAARQGVRFVLGGRDGRPLTDTAREADAAPAAEPDPALAADPSVANRLLVVTGLIPGAAPAAHRFAVIVGVPGAAALRLAAVVPVERLRGALASVGVPDGANAAYRDAGDVILARLDGHEEVVATRSRPLPDVGGRSEAMWNGQSRDGRALLAAFATSPLSGWRATIGVPESAIDAPLRRSLGFLGLASLGMVLGCTLAASMVGGRIARPIGALADAARRLGTGAHVEPAASGILEVDAVGDALGTASAELAKRRERLAESEERLRLALEAGRLGTWDLDLVRDRRVYSARSADILGISAAAFSERASWTRFVHPDDQDHARDALATAIAGGTPYNVEFRVRPPGGEERWVASQAIVLADAEGRASRVIGIHRDITSRRQMEEALRASEQRLRATQDHVGVGIAEVDAEGRYLAVNEAFMAITGYARDALVGRSLFTLSPADEGEADRVRFGRMVSGEEAESYAAEKRLLRADGAIAWVAVSASAVRDRAGRFLYGVRVVQDVTARRVAEESRRLLLHELNHRVKNTLATVQSVAMQSFRDVSDQEARLLFESRLLALSKAHDVLTREDWRGAGLREVVAEATAPYRSAGANDRFAIAGPAVRLVPRTALALAMALHELATNAAKYGALSVPDGRVALGWTIGRRAGLRRLRLRWEESDGPAVAPPGRRGFGTRLIERGLARELEGKVKLDFAPTGVVCLIDVPLESGPRTASRAAA